MRDEDYVLGLCDQVLGAKGERQRRFDFLRGDPNIFGRRAMLPVDAYYPHFNLAVEYWERQHTELVTFFDQRITVGGLARGVQRRKYDLRRKEVLPLNGIDLVVFGYGEFAHGGRKRLRRDHAGDLDVVTTRMRAVLGGRHEL